MTRRKLTAEEIDLWRKVAESAHRLHPEKHSHEDRPKPKPTKVARPRLSAFEMRSNAKQKTQPHDLLPGISDRIARQPVKMDKKAFSKLKRGKMLPEGKIDLHGMTLDQAHPALTNFILRSHAEGKRLVLVITGKGKSKQDIGPIPTRRGILKHNVPQWLSMPPLAGVVLQISEAHLKHGGTGAYYVYLRRH
ncbi:Smr/MutS family protein [Shimia sp. SDUM112013]|uniref:Smr/MutS family protein n=1 Tax=Shimia sp. SDUM112013 TaxID=3136160 RepID=UPI0032EE2753